MIFICVVSDTINIIVLGGYLPEIIVLKITFTFYNYRVKNIPGVHEITIQSVTLMMVKIL